MGTISGSSAPDSASTLEALDVGLTGKLPGQDHLEAD